MSIFPFQSRENKKYESQICPLENDWGRRYPWRSEEKAAAADFCTLCSVWKGTEDENARMLILSDMDEYWQAKGTAFRLERMNVHIWKQTLEEIRILLKSVTSRYVLLRFMIFLTNHDFKNSGPWIIKSLFQDSSQYIS